MKLNRHGVSRNEVDNLCKIRGEVSFAEDSYQLWGGCAARPVRAFSMRQWKDAQSRLWVPDFDSEGNRISPLLIEAGTRVPGLGHRVHRVVDPRVEVLFSLAREGQEEGAGVRFMRAVHAAARERIRPLPINIDGGLAAILHDLGFLPEAGKFIFIIGRVAGLTAEVAEEYAREKPMRVRIPVQYDGQDPRP